MFSVNLSVYDQTAFQRVSRSRRLPDLAARGLNSELHVLRVSAVCPT